MFQVTSVKELYMHESLGKNLPYPVNQMLGTPCQFISLGPAQNLPSFHLRGLYSSICEDKVSPFYAIKWKNLDVI